MGNAPCFKCQDRAVGCHGSCGRYKAFAAANGAKRAGYGQVDGYENDVIIRRQRAKARRVYG